MAEAEQNAVVDVPEEVTTKVSEQLRFYFGNVNLLRDRFMKDVLMKNNGWFPLETLLTFNRLKTILKDFQSEDAMKILVDGAEKLSMLEVNDDKKMVRRDQSIEIPSTRPECNTLVVKGFKTENVTMDDLLAFFKKFEGVEAVIMRSYREKVVEDSKADGVAGTDKPELTYRKKFKGSVFVVFDTVENAKVCLESLKDFKEESDLVNKDVPWEIMWQADHKIAKQEETKARHETKRKADDISNTKPDEVLGTIININTVPEGITREILKERWAEELKTYTGEDDLSIAFLDYKLNMKEGKIRLSKPSAKSAVEFMSGKLIFNNEPPVVLGELEEAAEKEYLKEVAQLKSVPKRAKQHKHHHGYGRGGRGGGRRR